MPSTDIPGGYEMKSNRKTAKFWRQHVQAFTDSRKTRVAYCRENRIKTHRLDYWRRKQKESTAEENQVSRKDWIPLQIHEDQAIGKGTGIRLHIGRLTIEVEPGFNPELLTEVIRIVGTAC